MISCHWMYKQCLAVTWCTSNIRCPIACVTCHALWYSTQDLHPHLTYPLTTRVVGAPQVISQPVSSTLLCLSLGSFNFLVCLSANHHHYHLPLNREGRWGTTDDFTASFLHFPPFSTALWDLANSRPVHSLILSSHLFLCLPCLLPPLTVPCKTTAVCISLRWEGSLRVVRLPAGSLHGLPCW